MRNFVKLVLLAEAFAVTTFGLGWWSVPLVAAAWGVLSRDSRRAEIAALCAMAGWATLLVLDAVRGSVGVMATQLGAVMTLHPLVLYAATLILPALLAWSAATLVPNLRKANAPGSP